MPKTEASRLRRYAVTLPRPDRGWDDLSSTVQTARRIVSDLDNGRQQLVLLRSVFIPEDESCLMLIDSESPYMAAEAARCIAISQGSHRTPPVTEVPRLGVALDGTSVAAGTEDGHRDR